MIRFTILKIDIMNEIKEIKIPEGVESISVTQHDDKIVIEFIPEEDKFNRGDILKSTITPELTVIFDKMTSITSFDSIYNNLKCSNHYWYLKSFRHATEEEKQEFFDELKADGKRWNAEKLIVEDIPQPVEEIKKGDLAIFWNEETLPDGDAIIARYNCADIIDLVISHHSADGGVYNFAVKWDGTKEQFEKILRGEI